MFDEEAERGTNFSADFKSQLNYVGRSYWAFATDGDVGYLATSDADPFVWALAGQSTVIDGIVRSGAKYDYMRIHLNFTSRECPVVQKSPTQNEPVEAHASGLPYQPFNHGYRPWTETMPNHNYDNFMYITETLGVRRFPDLYEASLSSLVLHKGQLFGAEAGLFTSVDATSLEYTSRVFPSVAGASFEPPVEISECGDYAQIYNDAACCQDMTPLWGAEYLSDRGWTCSARLHAPPPPAPPPAVPGIALSIVIPSPGITCTAACSSHGACQNDALVHVWEDVAVTHRILTTSIYNRDEIDLVNVSGSWGLGASSTDDFPQRIVETDGLNINFDGPPSMDRVPASPFIAVSGTHIYYTNNAAQRTPHMCATPQPATGEYGFDTENLRTYAALCFCGTANVPPLPPRSPPLPPHAPPSPLPPCHPCPRHCRWTKWRSL